MGRLPCHRRLIARRAAAGSSASWRQAHSSVPAVYPHWRRRPPRHTGYHDPMLWAPRDLENLIATRRRPSTSSISGRGAQSRAAGALRLHGCGCRRCSDLARQSRGLSQFQLRPRRSSTSAKSTCAALFWGRRYDSPIFICPTASNRAFHPDGEVAVAKAARSGNHLQISFRPLPQPRSRRPPTARGAHLVSALCLATLANRRGFGEAGGARGLPGDRCDHRRPRWQKPRNAAAPAPHRHATVLWHATPGLRLCRAQAQL